MLDLNNFDRIRIGLASPEQIRDWSSGEVKKPETINYRTLKPERDGLFCEKIFGPTRIGNVTAVNISGCAIKELFATAAAWRLPRSKVRRERMGHIELAAPVSHIWYFKGIPSRMGLLLDMSPRSLEKVLYFVSYIVIDPGDTRLIEKTAAQRDGISRTPGKIRRISFKASMGAEAVKELLSEDGSGRALEELRQRDLTKSPGREKIRAIRRLEVVEAFRKSGNKPEWMILDVVPVIPPELRPMVQLDGGTFCHF